MPGHIVLFFITEPHRLKFLICKCICLDCMILVVLVLSVSVSWVFDWPWSLQIQMLYLIVCQYFLTIMSCCPKLQKKIVYLKCLWVYTIINFKDLNCNLMDIFFNDFNHLYVHSFLWLTCDLCKSTSLQNSQNTLKCKCTN